MKQVERHIIKKRKPYYNELLERCKISNDLYNYVLYVIRQHYFHIVGKQYDIDIAEKYENKMLSYYDIDNILKESKNELYYKCGTNCAQEVIKQVCKNFNSFFKLLELKRKCEYNKKINIPKYRSNEYNICVYNTKVLDKMKLKEHIIKIPKTEIYLPIIHNDNCTQVRVIPKQGYIIYEVIYEKEEQKLKDDNKRYMSIDLGIDNLATCTSNVINSFIINGKPIKSINQYYNKKKAKLQSDNKKQNNSDKNTNKINRLSLKRKNKIDWYFHNASKYIVNQLVSNNINTLIVGKNMNWKQDTNLGKENNQKFIFIPFESFIHMLEYKCKLNGINFVLQEESYTSKVSFLDNEYIPTYNVDDNCFKSEGKRIKRGLYQTKGKYYINADVNGSLNIMRKYLNVVSNSIITERNRGLIVSPIRISF